MNGSAPQLGPDGSMIQAVAACIAGWLAAGAARADLDFVREALALLFHL